jgi:hypothetical protein
MKYVIFLVLWLLSDTSAFSQGVVLYPDCNFRGGSVVLQPGRYRLDQTSLGAFRLSSIKIASGYKAVLYNSYEPGTGDRKIRLTESVSCFGSDWNDQAASIIVEAESNYNTGDNYNNNHPVYPSYGNGRQVILFEDCSMRGAQVVLNPGRYNMNELGIRNDALSSMRIPNGIRVVLYEHPDFRGKSQAFYSNTYCLNADWNDKTSSCIIENSSGQSSGGYTSNSQDYTSARERVTVYEDCDFRGRSQSFSPGRYDMNNLGGVGNDKISSISVPSGFRVIVYEDRNFSGRSESFYGNVNCMDARFNDKTTSLIVEGPGDNQSGYTSRESSGYQNQNYSTPSTGITIYEKSWFKGDHTILNVGRHNLRNSFFDGRITSISMQEGYRIVVYDDYDFRGNSATFSSNLFNLSMEQWNDRIRSLIVYRN